MLKIIVSKSTLKIPGSALPGTVDRDTDRDQNVIDCPTPPKSSSKSVEDFFQ